MMDICCLLPICRQPRTDCFGPFRESSFYVIDRLGKRCALPLDVDWVLDCSLAFLKRLATSWCVVQPEKTGSIVISVSLTIAINRSWHDRFLAIGADITLRGLAAGKPGKCEVKSPLEPR
jgi:hypothetical protein